MVPGTGHVSHRRLPLLFAAALLACCPATGSGAAGQSLSGTPCEKHRHCSERMHCGGAGTCQPCAECSVPPSKGGACPNKCSALYYASRESNGNFSASTPAPRDNEFGSGGGWESGEGGETRTPTTTAKAAPAPAPATPKFQECKTTDNCLGWLIGGFCLELGGQSFMNQVCIGVCDMCGSQETPFAPTRSSTSSSTAVPPPPATFTLPTTTPLSAAKPAQPPSTKITQTTTRTTQTTTNATSTTAATPVATMATSGTGLVISTTASSAYSLTTADSTASSSSSSVATESAESTITHLLPKTAGTRAPTSTSPPTAMATATATSTATASQFDTALRLGDLVEIISGKHLGHFGTIHSFSINRLSARIAFEDGFVTSKLKVEMLSKVSWLPTHPAASRTSTPAPAATTTRTADAATATTTTARATTVTAAAVAAATATTTATPIPTTATATATTVTTTVYTPAECTAGVDDSACGTDLSLCNHQIYGMLTKRICPVMCGMCPGAAPSAVVSSRPTIVQIDASSSAEEHCTFVRDINFDGDNLLNGKVDATDEHSCRIKCFNHPSCTHFTFAWETCWMKHGRGVPTPYEGATSGTCVKTHSYPGCAADVEVGVHFKGYNLADGMHTALSPGQCCTLCQERPECKFYTYIFGQCYLKSSDAGRVPDGNGISGYVSPAAHTEIGDLQPVGPEADTANPEIQVSLDTLVDGPETVIRIKGLTLMETVAIAGGTLLFIIVVVVTIPVVYVKRKYGGETFRPPAESIVGFEENSSALSEDSSWANENVSHFVEKISGDDSIAAAPPQLRGRGQSGAAAQWWKHEESMSRHYADATLSSTGSIETTPLPAPPHRPQQQRVIRALQTVGLDHGGGSGDANDAIYEEPLLYNKSSRAARPDPTPLPSTASEAMPVFKPPFALTSFKRQRRVSKMASKTISGSSDDSKDFEI